MPPRVTDDFGPSGGWNLDDFDLLVIENVGNLVCPTAYDLGEDTRVALLSVTEGEDKPLKYPKLFHSADVVVITKTDIAEAVEWDRQAALDAVRSVNPDARIIETSARNGEGVLQLLETLLATPSTTVSPDPKFNSRRHRDIRALVPRRRL